MDISKSVARTLAKNGLEAGARVFRGVLKAGPDGIEVDGKNISEWLAQYDDLELLLIAAPIEPVDQESVVKTCYTCGRDYVGSTCPACAEARARLRG
jgi:hypothetical protein